MLPLLTLVLVGVAAIDKVCISTPLGGTGVGMPLASGWCCPAQSFTAVHTGPIERIDARISGSCQMKLSIRKGLWTEDIIGESVVRSGTRGLTEFTFNPPIEVVKGEVYTMYPVMVTGRCSWTVIDKADTYTGGKQGGYCPAGGCSPWAKDYVFRVWCPGTFAPATAAPLTVAPKTSQPSSCTDSPVVTVGGKQLLGHPVNGASEMTGNGLDYQGIPKAFGTTEAFFPVTPMEVGEEVTLECCSVSGCDFFVSIFHCPPCDQNGGLPGLLVGEGEGWDFGSCAPKCDVGKMVSLRKRLGNGDKVTLPYPTRKVASIVIFGKHGVVDEWCPNKASGGYRSQGPVKPSSCVCPVV